MPAELADGGISRRRLSGRVRSNKDDNKNQYGGTSLYTVVTMDPNDEVGLLALAPALCHAALVGSSRALPWSDLFPMSHEDCVEVCMRSPQQAASHVAITNALIDAA